jgi:hypothetical protein
MMSHLSHMPRSSPCHAFMILDTSMPARRLLQTGRWGVRPSDQTAGFVADNKAYEAWLRTQCSVVEEDLRFKHEQMAKKSFGFLRATYFRWAKTIEHVCPELKNAPHRCPGTAGRMAAQRQQSREGGRREGFQGMAGEPVGTVLATARAIGTNEPD